LLDPNKNYAVEILIPSGVGETYENYIITEGLADSQCVLDGLSSDINPINGFSVCYDPEGQDDDENIDLGIVPISISSLGDYAWHDLDGDGVQEIGEPGIQDVKVSLYSDAGILLATSFTDESGYYLFNNLEAGNYYLKFETSADYLVTLPNLGNDANLDSNIDGSNGSGTTPIIVLSPGENDLSWDAGFYKCAQIGDLIWFDVNENNAKEAEENGVNGIRVNLFRQMPDGDFILWDYTFSGPKPNSPSDDGYFKFCAAPGTYYLEFYQPPYGLVPAMPNVGISEEIDSDITGMFGDGTTDTFAVLSEDEKCDLGAGYYPMGTIGDFVFLDSNQNGLRESDELGLANVYIQAIDQEGIIRGEAYTENDGSYTMDYLQQTDVYLKFNVPSSYAPTIPHAGPEEMDSDVDNSNGVFTTKYYNVTSGEHIGFVDAGLILGAVPVTWLDFRGSLANNNIHYEIERSLASSQEFETIGKVLSQNLGINELNYLYEDYDISSSGTYYYRIKQIDLDGSYSYSETIAIEIQARFGQAKASIYPNPIILRLMQGLQKSRKN